MTCAKISDTGKWGISRCYGQLPPARGGPREEGGGFFQEGILLLEFVYAFSGLTQLAVLLFWVSLAASCLLRLATHLPTVLSESPSSFQHSAIDLPEEIT